MLPTAYRANVASSLALTIPNFGLNISKRGKRWGVGGGYSTPSEMYSKTVVRIIICKCNHCPVLIGTQSYSPPLPPPSRNHLVTYHTCQGQGASLSLQKNRIPVLSNRVLSFDGVFVY
jgi:hypothetical protein